MIRLYDFPFSSAAYRVRIALNLKGATYERTPINIAPGANEQLTEAYRLINPQQKVPVIEVDGRIAGQSMAIIEWIDEMVPGPPLLPGAAWLRLQARAFADTIACDIHPLNNLSPRAYLRDRLGVSEADGMAWYSHWITRGFQALEREAAAPRQTRYLFSDTPSIAEIALVPQVANARRFRVDITAFPALTALDAICREHEAFRRAAPESAPPV
ncbi:MAG: maleylacetoacetate isomerase [Hyphomonas sp.]